jgi:hypothetical protein
VSTSHANNDSSFQEVLIYRRSQKFVFEVTRILKLSPVFVQCYWPLPVNTAAGVP